MNNDQLDAFSEKINRAFDNGKPIVLSWEEAQWLGEQLSQLTERPPLGEEVDAEDIRVYVGSLRLKNTPWSNGCADLIKSLARSLGEKEREIDQRDAEIERQQMAIKAVAEFFAVESDHQLIFDSDIECVESFLRAQSNESD